MCLITRTKVEKVRASKQVSIWFYFFFNFKKDINNIIQAAIINVPPRGVTSAITVKSNEVRELVASAYIEPENMMTPTSVK